MYLPKNRTLSGLGDCPSGMADDGNGGCIKTNILIPLPGLPVPSALKTDAQGNPTNYQPGTKFAIVNVDPSQQDSSQPQSAGFFSQELIAGTGIKIWHALGAGGLLLGIAAVKGRKQQ
ncbi:MAG: hypothetical protein ACJ71W_05945 [Terriglobales bacterium]